MFALTSKNFLKTLRFGFSNIQNAKSNLKVIVEKQIEHQNNNLQDVPKIEKFFKDAGWNIKYNKTQVELQKTKGPHTITILFNARAPMPVDQQQQKRLQEETQDQQYMMPKDFSACSVLVKKTGSQKCLAAEFINSDQGSQMQNIQFIKDIEAQKVRKSFERLMGVGQQILTYQGPDLASLDGAVQQSLRLFLENLGITDDLLKQVSNFGVAYEQKFYIEWLKDINSLL